MKKTAESEFLKEDGSNYDKDAYEHAGNTVDICPCRVHNNQLQQLIIKRGHPPFKGKWCICGGFVDIERKESLHDAAVRELKEETHVTGIPIRQLGSYGEAERDPRMRMITTVYYAFLSPSKIQEQTIEADDDADDYKWQNIGGRVPKLGFDHSLIIKDLVKKIRADILTSPIAFEFVNNLFTWGELQDVYEAILGRKLVTSNFRRKINYLYDISESDVSVPISRGRYPKLLEFKGVKKIF